MNEPPPGTTFEAGLDQLVIRTEGSLHAETNLVLAFVGATSIAPVALAALLMFIPPLRGAAFIVLVAGQTLAMAILLGRSILTVMRPQLVITVDRRRISLSCPAFPWPLRETTFALGDVVQFYVFRQSHWLGRRNAWVGTNSASYHTFHLCVLQRNGWRRILCRIRDEQTAVAVEDEIEHFLGMPDNLVVSTWYQRYLDRELTHGDVADDESRRTALVARSLPIPRRALVASVLCASLFLMLFLSWAGGQVRHWARGVDGVRADLSAPTPLLNKPAPRAEVQTLAGETVVLPEAFAGKIVVLDFWATYSPISEKRSPWLKEWGQTFPARGVEVWQVNLGEAPDLAADFAKRQGWSGHLMRDHARQCIMTYRCLPEPNLFVIDRQGRIATGYRGADPWVKRLVELDVEKLLGDAAP